MTSAQTTSGGGRVLIPQRLHKVHTFEAKTYSVPHDGGRLLLPGLSTPTIERISGDWVDTTKNQIVGLGPVYIVHTREPMRIGDVDRHLPVGVTLPALGPDSFNVPVDCETRTLAVYYLPAVEQPANVQPTPSVLVPAVHVPPREPSAVGGPLRAVSFDAQSGGPSADSRSDPSSGRAGGGLRLPPV